jgi:hypothetical protein|tara:strand:- start:12987 stop:13394 length:408 start_codon:yes stop_codon:yes gene_type:complete
MARQTIYEPDVSIGDLLVLARLSALYWDAGKANPGTALSEESKVSATRIRNTMMRIVHAVGPVEIEGKSRRTQIPSARGRNVGAAGVIAEAILTIATDDETDQEALRMRLNHLLMELERQYSEGAFKTLAGPTRF